MMDYLGYKIKKRVILPNIGIFFNISLQIYTKWGSFCLFFRKNDTFLHVSLKKIG